MTRNSAGTARAGGILALLGVIHMMRLVLSNVAAAQEGGGDLFSSVRDSFQTIVSLQWFSAAFVGLLLALGGILMLNGKAVGRWFVVAGCTLHLVVWVVTGVWAQQLVNEIANSNPVDVDTVYMAGWGLSWAILMVFPLVTIGLTLAPSTARWFATQG